MIWYCFYKALRGGLEIPGEVLNLADLNGDVRYDNQDALLLHRYLAGDLSAFPVNCTHGAYTVRFLGDGMMERVCAHCSQSEPYRDPMGVPEEDLYRTALDNMEPNKDGSTIGNRKALLEWLREADKTCDYFIISLDQALSGGLVGSRWLSNTDLTFEYEIADEIIRLCKTNTVFLFDTVMRLASIANYQGYGLDDYNILRAYGQVARKTLYGDDLTIENKWSIQNLKQLIDFVEG